MSTARELLVDSPSCTPLLDDLLRSLWGQLTARLRTTLAPPESEARISLLKQTLEILSFTPAFTLWEESNPQTLAVATLRLNPRLLAHFETEDLSPLPLFHDRPAATGKHRRTRVEDINSTYLLILGLTGVVEASQDPGCVGAFGSDDMRVVIEQLCKLEIDWESSASFAPLDSASTFDLRRYAVEAVLGYHLQKLATNSATNEPACGKLLRDMLIYEWDDGSWITDLVFNTLTVSASGEMRDICAEFLCYNPKSVSRHPQVYNILYEILRMSRHESLSYFDSNHCDYLFVITRSFRPIVMTNSNDFENMQGSIDALLKRLVNNDLLGTLALSAYGSDRFELKRNWWQELYCGPTTSFWVERIISLAQKSNGQKAASKDPAPPNVVDRIREFCLAPNELLVEAQPNNKRKGDINTEAMGYSERQRHQFIQGHQTHLSEFKKVLLREIGDYTTQPAIVNEPQQPSILAMQPITQPEDDQPVDQSHTSIHIPQGEAIEEIFTTGTNTQSHSV
ncbi:hypothetical protein BDV93DRAFT_556594 [Ceratobasidium sp. AG-I]|nr:hypothetical protein BDV93DRAFT_556594 [Ceratobasidium sp. AG-I]